MVRHFIETNTIIYKTTYEKTPHLRGFFIFDIMRNIVVFIIPLLLIASCSFNPNPIRSIKEENIKSEVKRKIFLLLLTMCKTFDILFIYKLKTFPYFLKS